ncbi:MAG TPA: Ig-like domain repeat protein [Gemmatimonadales bacterium]|nr:Ig-like domain repeat protein [Gemmatimonadales bacterium]
MSGATATTGSGGAATFSGLAISGPAGSYTLSFGATGLTAATSGTITLGAGTATQLSITTEPSATAQSGAAFAQQPVLQLRDGAGNAVSQAGVTVTAAIATGGGTLNGTATATTNANGVASFVNLAITGTTGDRALSFSTTGLTGATSTTITITAGAATQLSITTAPSSSAASGAAFAQQPVVQIQDASGNPVSQSSTQVTATIASGPAGATLSGATATTGAGGAATFSGLAISGPAGSYTLSFGASGLTSATSVTITLGAGAATQLSITTQPSGSAQSGVAFAQQPVLQLRDGAGNAVSQAGVTVTAAIATGGGTLNGTPTATTNASGVASFTNLAITGAAGDRTLSFSATGLTGATSTTITITAGAATQLSITTQPSGSAPSGVAFAQQPVLQLRDGAGNAVNQAGVTVTAAIATGGGTLNGAATATTNANGEASFTNLAISGPTGSYTLSFSATGLTGATSSTITITAGAATQLAVTTQPSSSASSGTAFTQQPVVQMEDASGNPVSQSGTLVTATIASGPAGATLSGATATTGAGGAASFSGLAISGPTGSYTLSFGATGLTAVPSGAITLTAGAAAGIAANSPTTQSASVGTAVGSPPSVLVRDGAGNPVAGVAVTFAVATGGGTVNPTTPVTTTTSGIAAVTAWTLGTTAGTNTLTATAAGSGISGNPVTFTATGTPGSVSATQSTVSASPTTIEAGNGTSTITVTAKDANGNPLAGATVVLTATGSTNTLTQPGPTNGSGVATGTLSSTVAEPKTVSAMINSVAVTQTATVTVTPGPAALLTKQAGDGQTALAGSTLPIDPAVRVTDQFGNPVSSVAVTFAVASGGGKVMGPNRMTDASGVATVLSWTLGTTPGLNTLTATAAGSGISGNPATFTATGTAGAATQLVITTPPSSSAQSGVALVQQPVLQLEDANGNPVSQSGVTVTTTVAPAGATASNATATTGSNGAATFSGLTLSGTAGSYTLSFGATGLTAATSGTITLGAGAATQLSITTEPSATAQSGVAFAQQPVVQLRDGVGNAVSQAGVTVTAAIATGGGALNGTATATTNGSGVASFTNLAITGTAGDRTLSFSATGLTGATSTTISITAGAATQLVITTQPSSSAQGGVALAQQPVIQLQDANGNPVSQGGATVTATVGSGPTGATLGNATATTSPSGAAAFNGLAISGPTGTYTLQFSATSVASVTSSAIVLSAAATTTTITGHTPGSSVTGEGVSVTFTVTSSGGTPTGTVTVTDGSASCNNTVASGSCTLTPTTAGTKTLVASYAGDGNFAASTSIGVSHVVSAASTTTTLAAGSPNPSVVGEPVSFAFTVAVNAPGGGTPTGTVTVSNTSENCTASVATGSCSITFASAGPRTITASYAGDGNFASSASSSVSQGVSAASTTTTIGTEAPDPSTVGQAYIVNYAVAVTAPGAGTPTGTVTVSDGAASCSNTVGAGSCSLTSVTPGPKTLVATYGGDGNFTGSTSPGVPHTVNLTGTTTAISSSTPDPTIAGQPVTVAFSVTGSGGTPTGTVTVGDGTFGCTASVAAGSCQFTPTIAGTRILTATYSGDASFASSSSSGHAYTVEPAAVSQLVFTGQPRNTLPLVTINPAVVVTARDAFGNTVATFTDPVTIAIGTDGSLVPPAHLSGTLSVAAVSGSASFVDLSIDQIGNGYTLVATSGLLGVTSAPFNITLTP